MSRELGTMSINYAQLCLTLTLCQVKDDFLVDHPRRPKDSLSSTTVVIEAIAPQIARAFPVHVRLGVPQRHTTPLKAPFQIWKTVEAPITIRLPTTSP